MGLKSVLDSIEDVAEGLREHYVQGEDGKFYLDAEGVESLPGVAGLRRKRDELLRTNRQLKDQATTYEGFDLEEYDRLKQAEIDAKNEARNKSGNIDEIRTDYEGQITGLKSAAAVAEQKANDKIAKEQAAARGYFQTAEISQALTKAKGAPELLSHVIKKGTKVELNDAGKFELHVVDEAGTRRIKDAAGTFMQLDDLVTEIKKNPTYGRAFEGTGAGGSGASGDGDLGGGGGGKVISRDNPMDIGRNAEAIIKGEVTVK